MKTTDTMISRGMVTPYFLDIRTGERRPWPSRHNTLSYDASFAMASAFGGDATYIPNRIGIIYGANAQTEFDTAISRDQSWSDLHDELRGKQADVQVQSFSYSPSLKDIPAIDGDSSSSSGETRNGTAVIFHAHSDSYTSGAFGTAEGGQIFTSGMRIFQAVLLNQSGSDCRILARVSLHGSNSSSSSDSQYYQKPDNFEVALDWTVKFF